jgi:hypothetical protein
MHLELSKYEYQGEQTTTKLLFSVEINFPAKKELN